MIIAQVYVVDIVFGSKNDKLCEEFATLTKKEFEMSMMGELNFFLGFQIKQDKKEIFLNRSKHAKERVKKFGMENRKASQVPINANYKVEKDEDDKNVD